MTAYSPSFHEAIAQFDAANANDPNREQVNGENIPKELLYAQRMSVALNRLYPDASEELALAARAQHIRRWEHPRSAYPEGKAGYKEWRKQLSLFHAETATNIMENVGYTQEQIERVGVLIRKEKIKQNPEVQRLEDVICVVFLEHYLEGFLDKHQYEDEKMHTILRKTWAKMSEHGHQAALSLSYSPRVQALLQTLLT
jgi:hypothetical protein